MSELFLVRHSAVTVDRSRPAREWALSEQGRADAARLATWPRWRDVSSVVSSDEPKAVATAEPIAAAAGVPVVRQAAFREVDRGRTPVLAPEAYVALVRGYLGGGRVPGWEDRGTAYARFYHAVAAAVAQASGPVAVVSHGLILGVYLGLRVDQWEAIELPAVAVADADTRRLLARFRGVDELLADDRP